MATGDITAIVIRADGFSADVTIEGWSGKTVTSYDEGTLPNSGNMKLTVTSEGYNAAGTLGTVARTVSGTLVMRKAYPNEADFDETISGSDLVVRIALTDHIYDDDKNGGAGTSGADPVAVIASAYITAGDASTTNAHVGLTCTNSSTLDYPKVIGQWDWDNTPFYKRVESNFNMAFRARHGFGIAAVYLQALGAGSANDINSYKTSVTKQMAQNGLYHESYQQSVAIAGFTQAENINLKAIAYPIVGDADSIIDTSTNTTASQRIVGKNALTCTCDKTGGLKKYAVITTTGSDATGVTSTTLATAEASPYATIGEAIEDEATVIYARTGAHDTLGSTPATPPALDYFREVRPHPSDAASGINLTRNPTFPYYKASKLAYIGFTGDIICASGTGWMDGQDGDRILLFENSNFDNTTAPTVGLSYKSHGCWFVNCTGMGGDDYRDFSTTRVAYSFTGCSWIKGGGATPWYTMVACTLPNGISSGFGEKASANPAPAQDNVMFEYNTHYGITMNANNILVAAVGTTDRTGVSIVGNIFEVKTITSSGAIVLLGADGDTGDLTNVILAHNTVVGERCNLFYNDVGTSANVRNNIWCVGNAFRSYNIKTDTFGTPNANRIGNWAMVNGVGYRDNVYDGTAGSTFVNDYDGVNVTFETGRNAVFGDMVYVDEQSSDLGGAGDGDYTPDTGSALTGHTLINPFITYDLNGNPINSEIGAIQIVSASDAEGRIIPSDTDNVLILIKNIYVGGVGDIKITTAADEIVTFSSVPVGRFNPGCRIKKVFDTGTTATNMIGFI